MYPSHQSQTLEFANYQSFEQAFYNLEQAIFKNNPLTDTAKSEQINKKLYFTHLIINLEKNNDINPKIVYKFFPSDQIEEAKIEYQNALSENTRVMKIEEIILIKKRQDFNSVDVPSKEYEKPSFFAELNDHNSTEDVKKVKAIAGRLEEARKKYLTSSLYPPQKKEPTIKIGIGGALYYIVRFVAKAFTEN